MHVIGTWVAASRRMFYPQAMTEAGVIAPADWDAVRA
jgi:hypothetical protein